MEIIYKDKFKKRFRKLDHKIKDKFRVRLNLFLANKNHPLLNNHSVDKKFPGCRSINITGDFRLIFQDLGNTIILMKIGTHPELYG